MRIACGLRLRDRAEPAAPGHDPHIGLDTPSIAEDLLIGLRAVSRRIAEECINTGKDACTFALFKYFSIPKHAPNMDKERMRTILSEDKLMVPATCASRKGLAALLPVIETQNPLCNIADTAVPSAPLLCFPEVYDMGALNAYLYWNPSRAINAAILQEYFQEAIVSVKKKRGKLGKEEATHSEHLEECLRKHTESERFAHAIGDTLGGVARGVLDNPRGAPECPDSVGSPQQVEHAMAHAVANESPKHDALFTESPQRRRRSKTVEQPLQPICTTSVLYRYTMNGLLRTRRQSMQPSAQNCSRRVLHHLARHTVDLDIENCMFTILSQIVEKLGVDLPKDIQTTLRLCATDRARICLEFLGCDQATGKHLLTTTMSGVSLTPPWKQIQFLQDVQRLSRYMRWVPVKRRARINITRQK